MILREKALDYRGQSPERDRSRNRQLSAKDQIEAQSSI
jgi:hypothetical protein